MPAMDMLGWVAAAVTLCIGYVLGAWITKAEGTRVFVRVQGHGPGDDAWADFHETTPNVTVIVHTNRLGQVDPGESIEIWPIGPEGLSHDSPRPRDR